jgi:LPXTG-motif cell wall-anchored protein
LISTGLLFAGAAAAQAEDSVGNQGVGSGNQVNAPITVPVTVCGNNLDVLGQGYTDADQSCGDELVATPEPTPRVTEPVTPSSTPSASTSPSSGPGAGGSPDESLPLTGTSVGWLVGVAMLLLGGGGAMILLARRRIVRRGAHAA